MKSDTAFKIVNLILNVFGLPTGLFSKIKETVSIGKELSEQNKISKKERFIQELNETARNIVNSENASKDVLEKVMITLTDDKLFSPKKVLNHFNDIDEYCNELTDNWYKNDACTDPSAEGYKRVMKQLLQAVYNNLSILEITSDSEEAMLSKLYSYNSLMEDIKDQLEGLHYKGSFAEWLDNTQLPPPIKCNIFNYCNPQIRLHGREKELEQLRVFVNNPGISVWGITGPGGIGKSKLAREFAQQEKPYRKTVWLDTEKIKRVLNFTDFSYPLPILFVCDYVSQYKEELITLIKLLCTHRANIKFLLLERQKTWYVDFFSKNDIIRDWAFKDSTEPKAPIDLTEAIIDDSSCKQIIDDLFLSKYGEHPERNLSEDDKDIIISSTKKLSEKNGSVRCLFLLLLTDAYIHDNNINAMNAQKLLHNYIEHSYNLISKQYEEKIAKNGYNVLAFATACNGIEWENDHPAIKECIKQITEYFVDDRDDINSFFCQLSEIEQEGVVSAFKPDLIGELLFLYRWNKLPKPKKEEWLVELLPQEFCRTFFAHCLTDWLDESKKFFLDMLTDKNNDIGARICCSDVFKSSVIASDSVAEKMGFVKKIKNLDYDYSIQILSVYIDALCNVFNSSLKDTRKECIDMFDQINFEKYKCETDEDSRCIGILIFDIANKYQENAEYKKALEYYDKSLQKIQKNLSPEHPSIAMIYNNIGEVYRDINKLDDALVFYEKALKIYNDSDIEPIYRANVYNNMALVYQENNDYDKALKLFEEVLPIFEKVYGDTHQNTATIYNNIALAYKCKKKLELAKKYYEKALNITRSVSGLNSVSEATVLNNLGSIYLELNDHNEANNCFTKSLEICKNVLGENHNYTANACTSIAGYYYDIGEYDNALKYAHESEKILESVFNNDNADTKNVYSLLAQIYKENNDPIKANEYKIKAGIISK